MSEQPSVIEEIQLGEWLVLSILSNGQVRFEDSISRLGITLSPQDALTVFDVLLEHVALLREKR